MELQGIHHITCICADAARNVDFYARVLGLRLVKKTVNFDQPEAYHLYYGDERGSPGSLLTFFEFRDAAPGRAGAGMIHRLQWRVASDEALGFWDERLGAEGIALDHDGHASALAFSDPEGLRLELVVQEGGDPPLTAAMPGIPEEHALLGFHGVRAYVPYPEQTESVMTEVLGFEEFAEGSYRVTGGGRHAIYVYDAAPEAHGLLGAGTVHHIAWATTDEDQEQWRRTLAAAGANVTPIIDRQYFQSIYFREPRGVLFEIATLSPGFAIDEDPDALGEELKLPPQHEHLRDHLERTLVAVTNPRAGSRPRA